jgi:gamma-glutamyltranspeptidase / glutathione hydrolase
MNGTTKPAIGSNGAVATANPIATKIGMDILKTGGKAVDAAVAASFALGVVEPFMSGIGGGGFIVLYDAATAEVTTLDARGVAPGAATEDMFVSYGEVQYDDIAMGHRSALVPGLLAGLEAVHGLKGSLPLSTLIEPAARVAEAGYEVSSFFASWVREYPRCAIALGQSESAAQIYLRGGALPHAGDRLANPDLAATYRTLGKQGIREYYEGGLAQTIVAEMRRGGGLIDAPDLARYRPAWRPPVWGTYRDLDICSLGPPSSGGILVIQALNMLEAHDLATMDRWSAPVAHLLAETLKPAYADRAHFVGDPGFVDVPVSHLISKDYARQRSADLDMAKARQSPGRGDPFRLEGSAHTTHLCVADRDGNVVGITQTVGSAFGSGVVVPGTGILLNHLMSDFSPMVGASTVHGWGTYTSNANAIAPGKTPASSNTPLLLLRNGKPVLCTGAAGGSRIPSTVLQVVLNVADWGMDVQAAIAAPRLHDQGEGLELENGWGQEVVDGLRQLGHRVVLASGFRGGIGSHAQALAVDQERSVFSAGAETRGDGLSLAY